MNPMHTYHPTLKPSAGCLNSGRGGGNSAARRRRSVDTSAIHSTARSASRGGGAKGNTAAAGLTNSTNFNTNANVSSSILGGLGGGAVGGGRTAVCTCPSVPMGAAAVASHSHHHHHHSHCGAAVAAPHSASVPMLINHTYTPMTAATVGAAASAAVFPTITTTSSGAVPPQGFYNAATGAPFTAKPLPTLQPNVFDTTMGPLLSSNNNANNGRVSTATSAPPSAIHSLNTSAAVGGAQQASLPPPPPPPPFIDTTNIPIEEKIAALETETTTCQHLLMQQEGNVGRLKEAFEREQITLATMRAEVEEAQRAVLRIRQLNAVAGPMNQSLNGKSEEDLLVERLAERYMRAQYKGHLPPSSSVTAAAASSAASSSLKSAISVSDVTRRGKAALIAAGMGHAPNRKGPTHHQAPPSAGTTNGTSNTAGNTSSNNKVAMLTMGDYEGLIEVLSNRVKALADECAAHALAKEKATDRKATAQQAIGKLLGNNSALEGDVTRLKATLQRKGSQKNSIADAIRDLQRQLASSTAAITAAEEEMAAIGKEMQKLAARREKHDANTKGLMRQQDAFAAIGGDVARQGAERQALIARLTAENKLMTDRLLLLSNARRAVMADARREGDGEGRAAAAASNSNEAVLPPQPQPLSSPSSSSAPCLPPLDHNPAAPLISKHDVGAVSVANTAYPSSYPSSSAGAVVGVLSPEDKVYADMFDTLMRTAKAAGQYQYPHAH